MGGFSLGDELGGFWWLGDGVRECDWRVLAVFFEMLKS